MENKKVRWIKTASRQFEKAIKYIAKDSIQNAEKVRLNIIAKTNKLSLHPEFYSPDKYKTYNPNHKYRAFELHRYRITYRIKREEILITKMRHTNRKPRYY